MNTSSDIEVDYTKLDKKVEKIIKRVNLYMPSLSKEYISNEIKKAYIYARDAHKWVFRLSWEPYISHPVEATLLLLDLKPDILTIQACLLHDVIEDTTRTYEDILEVFWEEVANLCAWMEKLSKVRYKWEERSIWSLRKMFIAMAEDIRVVFIKLADRLHNMKTLKYHPKKEKRDRISLETLNIYSPIADRLWLYDFKNQLDTECFKILEPNEYIKIIRQLNKLKDTKISFEKNAKLEVDNLLNWTWINYEIDFRVKSIYSIYKKMKLKWYEKVSDLYDLYWIRIVVDNIPDCYRVLWIIHNKWAPLPKRFKDYIALPKPNWYRSLHTTVIWLLKNHRKQPTEIQIKTLEMKEQSEIWIAAHFEYKEKWSKIAKDIDWVKELKDLTEKLWNNEFIESLKIDIFKDRIFVLTPKWDTVNLPAWSTPIDFAYEIHTYLWNHIVTAKVNGQVYPLDKELHNWDVVDVIIDKNKKPNPFWISFVKTTKAKNCIKSFLKNENKDLHRERGRDIMNKYLEKCWFEKLDKDLSLLKILDWKENSFEERWQILEQVWNFSITASSLLKRIFKVKKIKQTNKIDKKNTFQAEKTLKKEEKDKIKNIIIWWEKNLPYKIGHCCEWRLSDKIVWYINSKGIITIHNRDCKFLNRINKDRLLSAYYEWDEKTSIIVDISFLFENKIWVLKELSDILYSMNISTIGINTKKAWLNEIILDLELELLDYDYLLIDRFIDRVKLKMWKLLKSFEIKKIEW